MILIKKRKRIYKNNYIIQFIEDLMLHFIKTFIKNNFAMENITYKQTLILYHRPVDILQVPRPRRITSEDVLPEGNQQASDTKVHNRGRPPERDVYSGDCRQIMAKFRACI